jgi:speckle-type POZ protein
LKKNCYFLCRGYKRFFRRAGLETSDYLKNDSLSIRCTVGVVVSSTQGPQLYSIPVPESNIGEQFGAILDEGENTDIVFNVGRETFHAHKLVLAARSPVFKAQLFGPLADHTKEFIDVEDIEPAVFKVMFSFSLSLGNEVGQNMCIMSGVM